MQSQRRNAEKILAILSALMLFLPFAQAQLLTGVSVISILLTVVVGAAALTLLLYVATRLWNIYFGTDFSILEFIQHIGFVIRVILSEIYNRIMNQGFWAGTLLFSFGLALAIGANFGLPTQWAWFGGLMGALGGAILSSHLGRPVAALVFEVILITSAVFWVIAMFFPGFYSQMPVVVEQTAEGVAEVLDDDVIEPIVCGGRTFSARAGCTFQQVGAGSFEYETRVKQCVQQELNETGCLGPDREESTKTSDPINVDMTDLIIEGLPSEYRVESHIRYPLASDIDDRPIRRTLTDFTYAVSFQQSDDFIDAAQMYTNPGREPGPNDFRGLLSSEFDRVPKEQQEQLQRLRPTQEAAMRTIFGYEDATSTKGQTVHGDISKLQAGKSIEVTKQQLVYTFNTTAAFTDASRFRTGDYTIKIWNFSAWEEKTFREQNIWQEDGNNCQEVTTIGGGTIRRQATAALKTPVRPVMYTGCGTFFFQQTSENRKANDRYHIPLTVSANAHDQGGEPYFFEILSVDSNCFPDGYDSPLSEDGDDVNESEELEEALVGRYTPNDDGELFADQVEVYTPVEVQGEVTEHTCSINMEVRVGLERTGQTPSSIPIPPDLEDEVGEGGGGTAEGSGPAWPHTGGERVVWITEDTTTGGFGGIDTADNRCQSAASSAYDASDRTIKALISDSTVSAADRIQEICSQYTLVNPNGDTVATSCTQLWSRDEDLANPIRYNITGDAVNGLAWTGTRFDGETYTDTCDDWTSTSSNHQTQVGDSQVVDGENNWVAKETQGCFQERHLYCFDATP